MKISTKSIVGYVGAVVGVIAVASLAVFAVQETTAKAHRPWDAELDRIIARQQVKKVMLELARDETPTCNAMSGCR